MTFTESVKTCFRKYITFSGRASRSEFWWFTLFAIGLGVIASLLETGINAVTANPDGPLLLSTAASLATLVHSTAVTWRRLHDIGKSGLWYPSLILAIPLAGGLAIAGVGMALARIAGWYPGLSLQLLVLGVIGSCFVVLLVWLSRPSHPGPNPYGPNPHEVTP